jgi:ATP-dependent exoDNAse (exonuclease V) beta subunit
MGYGDVALLFQSMTRAPLYEEVFKTAGLPYVTMAGKGYYDRPEVWDLLNLLRALHNPADDLALAVALRSPLFGLSDDALFSLRLARDNETGETLPLWAALRAKSTPYFPAGETAARDFARDVLIELGDMAGRATVAEVLIRALDLTGYLATLTGLSDGARRRGNIEKLVALARESGRISLGAFNAYARDLTAREVREGEAVVEVEGAVQIMSVHASKGLEFPVVVLADASWNRARRYLEWAFTVDPELGAACQLPVDDPDADEPQPFAWGYAERLADSRDRAERRRLLYVGATRTQDYLIVSGSLHRCPDQAWLKQWLDALGVEIESLEPGALRYEWGECALVVPQTVTLPDNWASPLNPHANPVGEGTGWAGHRPAPTEDLGDGLIAGFAPELPPLLADVPADPVAPARVLTATQINYLGRAPYYDPMARGKAAFRHAVLHDAPDPIHPLPERATNEKALRRSVGEIVHRALRGWSLPDNTPEKTLMQRLTTYAWEARLSDDDLIAAAVVQALDLLRRFARSDARADLDRAKQIYRELPFVYRSGDYTLHGQMDVLYFDGRGWHVLDYKTAQVSVNGAYDNARRYYLQVGVYAKAVEARVGAVPETHLYYIHPARRVYVKPEDWQAALARLDDDLRDALGGEEK